MLKTSTVAIVLASAVLSVSTGAQPKHAVVFLIDDLGYGDTGHRGAEYPTTAIDALAANGVVLNQSYVMQLCSPTRSALLGSRYPYTMGMDGNVLTGGDERCMNTSGVDTLGDRLSRGGVATAFIGKYDVGYSSYACTANCRGFDYWLGYYGAAEDYYLHGGGNNLDFHEQFEQAPQYRGEYSTALFTRKGIEWARNATARNASQSTLLYLSFQAVHGPIEAPPNAAAYESACGSIEQPTRKTYCEMMQALDEGIANITAAYKQLGIYDDTLFLFLADNGGQNADGGFNEPLRGQKATVWEGGVRSQTFVAWSGFSAGIKGKEYGGMAHAVDWGPTLQAALLGSEAHGEDGADSGTGTALDGKSLWPSLSTFAQSPRTEMLLSVRDAGQCSVANCEHPGQLAYRSGKWKLISGHPDLRGKNGNTCAWQGDKLLCWNGWGRPKDKGMPRPPIVMPERPGQPPNTSLYAWGAQLLFDIESDPLEEHDLSQAQPDVVKELQAKLDAYVTMGISQDVYPNPHAKDTEPCGSGLSCAVPWLPHSATDRCTPAPTPAPTAPTPAPPAPPAPVPTPPTPPAPGTNCCQCLHLGGGTTCGPMCAKKDAACVECITKGGGASCRPSCGCKRT